MSDIIPVLDAELIETSFTSVEQQTNSHIEALAKLISASISQNTKETDATTDDEIIQEFLAARCTSPHTLRNYTRIIKQFRTWYPVGLNQVTTKHLANYAGWLTHLYSKNTAALYMAAVKSLMSYCLNTGYIQKLPGKMMRTLPKTGAIAQRLIAKNELQTLIKNTNDKQQRALYLLLASTGLRISEALNIKWEDLKIMSDGSAIAFVLGKGNKERSVKIIPKIMALFPNKINSDYIFSYNGAQLRYNRAYRLFKKDLKAAKLSNKISFHWLRHYYGTEALKSGESLKMVMKMLGHASPATTMIYAEINDDSFASLPVEDLLVA